MYSLREFLAPKTKTAERKQPNGFEGWGVTQTDSTNGKGYNSHTERLLVYGIFITVRSTGRIQIAPSQQIRELFHSCTIINPHRCSIIFLKHSTFIANLTCQRRNLSCWCCISGFCVHQSCFGTTTVTQSPDRSFRDSIIWT